MIQYIIYTKQQFYIKIYIGEKQNTEQMEKWAEMKQRKKEKLLKLVGNKAPTMGQVNLPIWYRLYHIVYII